MSTTEVATPPKPNADYRLRGLELGSSTFQEPSTRLRRNNRRARRRILLEMVALIVIAAAVVVVLRSYVVQPFSVPSSAMAPTLQVGDRILAVKATFPGGAIGRGDIVIFRRPKTAACGTSTGNARDVVQRVIAMPGELIWSVGGTIYINGRPLQERSWFNPQSGEAGTSSITPTLVPPNHYFVMGDDRGNACDSRVFGTISKSSIVGRVIALVMRNGHPDLHVF